MAVNKAVESTSISIEVQNGLVKADADLQAVYDVAGAFKNIMDGATRDTLINITSSLTQA